MLQEAYQYFVVYGLSMFKFILGPITARIYEMNLFETVLFTVLGMMTSVFLFSTILGNKIHVWIMKSFYKNRKLFSRRNRRMVKIWREYGLKGVAFLTPILFTPIGGTIIANSFGEHRNKIFKYMFVSALFWAVIISFAIFTFKIENIHLLNHK
jgi:hypothetical protein